MRVRRIGPISTFEPAVPSYYVSFPSSPSKEGTKLDNGYAYNFLVRDETMEDEPSPPLPTGFKPCLHSRVDVGPWLLPARMMKRHYNASRLLVEYDYSRASIMATQGWSAPISAFFTERGALPVFTSDDRWRIARCWDKAQPQLKPKLNLLVFLAELDECWRLAISLGRKLKSLLRYGRNLVQLFNRSNGLKVCARSNIKALAEVTFSRRAIAANWLELNFALLPFANDVVAIVNSFLRLAGELEALKKGAGKVHKTHVSVSDVDNAQKTRLVASSCTYCGTNCTYSAIPSSERGMYLDVQFPGGIDTRIGATFVYRYSLPDWVDSFIGKADALLQVLGCSLSPAVLWELIPFSFVVDWIFPVGSILSRLRLDPFPVKTEILDFCVSKKVKTPYLFSGRLNCPLNSEESITQGRVVSYARSTDHSLLSSSPGFTRPGWYQLSLSAALLQSLWKSKRGT